MNRLFFFSVILFLSVNFLFAQQHENLKPLLIDLDGYEADNPEGMTIDMGTTKMINALRDYSNENVDISTSIIIANQMMMSAKMQEFSFQSEGETVKIEEIDGFKVSRYFNENEKEFSITVYIEGNESQSGVFIFMSTGLEKDAALNLSKQFNWEQISEAVKNIIKL